MTLRNADYSWKDAARKIASGCGQHLLLAKFETGIKCGLDVEVNKARLTGPF
jgi:hypothetical protein